MDEKDRRELEIEQLKRKVERHREALSVAKTEKANADHHLRRRVTALEKKMEKVNEQLLEMTKLADENAGRLKIQMNDLAEQYSKLKGRNTKEQIDSPGLERLQLPRDLPRNPEMDPRRLDGTAPSFRQLKQLTQVEDVLKSTFNHNSPPHFASHTTLKGLSEPVVVDIQKEIALSGQEKIVKPEQQEFEPVKLSEEPTNNMTGIPSPFWDKFKKK